MACRYSGISLAVMKMKLFMEIPLDSCMAAILPDGLPNIVATVIQHRWSTVYSSGRQLGPTGKSTTTSLHGVSSVSPRQGWSPLRQLRSRRDETHHPRYPIPQRALVDSPEYVTEAPWHIVGVIWSRKLSNCLCGLPDSVTNDSRLLGQE